MRAFQAKHYLYAAAACLLGIIILLYYYFFSTFSIQDKTSYIYIDQDDTPDSVYQKLSPLTTVQAMAGLRTLLRHDHYEQHLLTGRYAIEPGQSVWTVFRLLRQGHQSPIMLTIPESRTMEKLASTLSQRLMLDSLTIIAALKDSAFCDSLGYDTCTIACIFVPNTYEVYWNTSLPRLMHRMQREHQQFWNYDRQHKADAIGLTPNEVCTLASIIDEETANQKEKPIIAGMYLNRLQAGMPLQADPTVKYALRDFGLRRIYHNMLTTDSPYNTYLHAGLPPGPIKIASIQGIDAVLGRVQHDYLYMCANADFSGTHVFARTYREHQQNAARYTKALNERGVK